MHIYNSYAREWNHARERDIRRKEKNNLRKFASRDFKYKDLDRGSIALLSAGLEEKYAEVYIIESLLIPPYH